MKRGMQSLLANRAFRRLFAGRLVTNAGDSLYAVAAMWLVYDLTGSTAYTGLAGALTMGPQLLQGVPGPPGGPPPAPPAPRVPPAIHRPPQPLGGVAPSPRTATLTEKGSAPT